MRSTRTRSGGAATAFEFVSHRFEPRRKTASFVYRIHRRGAPPLTFTERLVFERVPSVGHMPPATLARFLQSLHLVLGTGYYKIAFPPRFLHPYRLTEDEVAFWTMLYREGMGEFLYRNRLDPVKVARFHASTRRTTPAHILPTRDQALVNIGGGKDSLLTVELMRENGKAFSPFVVDKPDGSPLLRDVVRAIGKKPVTVTRILDAQLFSLPGQYKGHIPISAVYAFVGTFAAALYGYRQVIVSNERSSDFGNVRYRGLNVNHQWSKSTTFERAFQEYCRHFLTPSITFFSVLRPFHTLRVTKMFAERKKYFDVFSSCNTNFRQHRSKGAPRWCGSCDKCVSVFALLAPFVPRATLIGIFRKNLFADPKLMPLYRDQLGFGTMKPFECVGTFEETQAAFLLAAKRWRTDLAIRTFLPKIRLKPEGVRTLFSTTPAPAIPTEFRFFGMNNALLLGYGKEGKTTRRFLKKFYPKLPIGIADEGRGDSNGRKQLAYDVAVKSPGIQKEKVFIQYTTATNLFFSCIKNPIVGVTASKGKSTTASLLHAMLRAGGVHARLLGNIGEPMLGAFLKPMDRRDMFVLELSSYQLDDIERSPNVALVLNLFPEHLNYHGSFAAYAAAKRNIIRFQNEGDTFVYRRQDPTLREWAKEAAARRVTIKGRLPTAWRIPLLGAHNRRNVAAAATVARLFGVKDAAIRKAVESFRSLPHRLERVGEYRSIEFYDDAISTTPESTIEALRALKNVRTIFLGGEDRGYDFTDLERELRACGVQNVVLFPETGNRMLRSTKGLNVLRTRSMAAAVRFAYRITPKGARCLLSTASPSYSVWRDYMQKGEEFQANVRRYGGEGPRTGKRLGTALRKRASR